MWGKYEDVGQAILGMVEQINGMFRFVIDLLQNTDQISKLIGSVDERIKSAVSATALTLCVLFFLIDFFRKSMDLQWVKWENVLMFFTKLFIAKVFVENAEGVLNIILKGFGSLTKSANLQFTDLIPLYGSAGEGTVQWGNYHLINSNGTDSNGNAWADAFEFFLAGSDLSNVQNRVGSGFFDISPMFLKIQVTLLGILLQVLMVIVVVIVIARMFEITVYTIVSPIPLSTLACDGLSDVGKGFLKSYTAVCLQALMLIVMFFAYKAMDSTILSNLVSGAQGSGAAGNVIVSWLGFIKVFALAAGVLQSGAWAKRICGAM